MIIIILLLLLLLLLLLYLRVFQLVFLKLMNLVTLIKS